MSDTKPAHCVDCGHPAWHHARYCTNLGCECEQYVMSDAGTNPRTTDADNQDNAPKPLTTDAAFQLGYEKAKQEAEAEINDLHARWQNELHKKRTAYDNGRIKGVEEEREWLRGQLDSDRPIYVGSGRWAWGARAVEKERKNELKLVVAWLRKRATHLWNAQSARVHTNCADAIERQEHHG